MRKTISTSIIAGLAFAAGTSARAADASYERLVNPEPHNWLMNPHDYSAQRYSALAAINKGNAKGLRLAFADPLRGSSRTENLAATPLVGQRIQYVTRAWGLRDRNPV